MAARIRSLRNALFPLDEVSRDDLIIGDIVTVAALDAATTYAWTLTFAPEGSTATFSGNPAAVSPGSFTVDLEGSYLVRLVVDAALPSEDVQYVRLRALTVFGQLHLIAAGERRDETGVIPVDVDTEGWANEQNANLLTLLNFVKPLVSSGRVFYVDANDGTENYADYDTIQEAIDAAVAQTPTDASQWVILVRPGRYIENLTLAPFVHVLGWPGNPDGQVSEAVVVEGTHTATTTATAQQLLLANLHIENNANTPVHTLGKAGDGTLRVYACRIESNGTHASQGAALSLTGGTVDVIRSTLIHNSAGAATRSAYRQAGASTVGIFQDCVISGPSGLSVNPAGSLATGLTCQVYNSKIFATHASGTGISSMAEEMNVQNCDIETAGGTSVAVNPTSVAFAGDVELEIRFSRLSGGILYDITGLTGADDLKLGSVIYTATTFPGGSPTYEALTKAKTVFYDNTASGLTAENVQDAIDEVAALAAIAPVVYHKNMPEIPNDTVRYRGWAPIACELIGVRVYMQTVNSVGTYTLTVTNNATGNTVLSAASFNMNTLVAATVTPVGLTGVAADLLFATLDRWTIALTSNNPGFNGEGIYVELVFNPATGGGPIVEDLATTLLIGNITGGTDIELTTGDEIVGQTDVVLRSTGAASDIEMFPGAAGAVIVNGKLTVTGIIDPTAVVFDQASVPTTGATEGGLFVSNGTGGLDLGNLYFRPASSGSSIRVSHLGIERTLLHRLQFEASTVGNILPAAIFFFDPTLATTNPSNGDILVLNDGFNPAETFTFKTVPAGAFDVGINAGDVKITLTNLATAIETDSARFRAVKVIDLTRIHTNTAVRGHAVIIVCRINATPGVPRIYGTFAVPLTSRPRRSGFTSSDLRYNVDDTITLTLPTADPGVRQSFGYEQVGFSALSNGQVRVTASEPALYTRQLVSPTSGVNWIPVGPAVEQYGTGVAVSPGNTVTNFFFVPRNVTIVGIKVYAHTVPVTAGTYTLAVDADGSGILSAATFDLTSLSAAVLTSVSLTATTSLLNRLTGSRIRFSFASNNGDLTASGMHIQILYRSRTL
jgi:hypothetical protein